MRRWGGDVEALLLPAACLGCASPLRPREQAQGCCESCRCLMRRIAPPACRRCGQPLDRWSFTVDRAGAPEACGFCREWPAAFRWAASACWLEDGPAREVSHALKYGGWTCAAVPMAGAIARHCAARLGGVDLLVPVPLGARRLRERGYNQAAVLAGALGRQAGLPVRDVLVRRRETASQTALSRHARWANVAGAFTASGPVAGARVALVDDVLTTGATLAAAAEALAAAGAAGAGAVTFGRALVPATT